jgi:alpha-1,2-mannosyltransferase
VSSPVPPAVRFAYLFGVFAVIALAVLSIVTFVEGLNPGAVAFDFRGAFLPAAHDVRGGESPYPPVEGPALASQTAYVYPPLLAYALIPFTIVSLTTAIVVAVIGVAALLVATLAVLGVRDLRCYAAMFLWAPTVNELHTASASVLVTFAAAVAWRYRATVLPLGVTVGLGIATKLVLWPLLVWTAATSRLRVTATAALVGGGITLVLWSLLEFDGLERYPAMLRRLAELEAEESYSLLGAFAELGLGDVAARALAFVVGVALLAACVALARRGDDFRSFTFALAASLALTPIVWLHYLVLLLVPLAIARPRFSAVWLMPLLLFLTPLNGNGESIQPLLPALVAVAVITLVLVEPEPLPDEPTTAPAVGSP